jgi:hypothetical protein
MREYLKSLQYFVGIAQRDREGASLVVVVTLPHGRGSVTRLCYTQEARMTSSYLA